MSASRAIYLDSSAIVKLAVTEPESVALRRFLHKRRPAVSSSLARTEVSRALLPLGPAAVERGRQVLSTLDLLRVSDRVLSVAGDLLPAELRSLDAIHIATALVLSNDLAGFITYDLRLAAAAEAHGQKVKTPK